MRALDLMHESLQAAHPNDSRCRLHRFRRPALGRLWARGAMLIVLQLAFVFSGCQDEIGNATPTPAMNTVPTSTATSVAPSSTPTAVGTGIPEVDHVIELVRARDVDGLVRLVEYQSVACVTARSAGGPPACLEGESPGTVVTVFPSASCQGLYVRDARPLITATVSLELYGAVHTPGLVRRQPYEPLGEYRVVTAERVGSPRMGRALLVESGRVVAVWNSCGPVADLLQPPSSSVLLGPLG